VLPAGLGQIDAIVFDVDGTLYRQRTVRATMLGRLLRECVLRPRAGVGTVRVLRAYRRAQEQLRENDAPHASGARGAAAQLALAAERTGMPAPAVAATVARWMEQEPLPLIARAVLPGLESFLAQAANRGLRLGVLSDYPAQSKLEALGIAGRFEVVVCAQDPEVGVFKPDPRGLLLALDRLGVPPERALYVGDRPEVDGVTARRAGVSAVIVGRAGQAAVDGVSHVADYATPGRALCGGGPVASGSRLGSAAAAPAPRAALHDHFRCARRRVCNIAEPAVSVRACPPGQRGVVEHRRVGN
jgi:HAD superfamily hydrolase (TIGR01509 family)